MGNSANTLAASNEGYSPKHLKNLRPNLGRPIDIIKKNFKLDSYHFPFPDNSIQERFLKLVPQFPCEDLGVNNVKPPLFSDIDIELHLFNEDLPISKPLIVHCHRILLFGSNYSDVTGSTFKKMTMSTPSMDIFFQYLKYSYAGYLESSYENVDIFFYFLNFATKFQNHQVISCLLCKLRKLLSFNKDSFRFSLIRLFDKQTSQQLDNLYEKQFQNRSHSSFLTPTSNLRFRRKITTLSSSMSSSDNNQNYHHHYVEEQPLFCEKTNIERFLLGGAAYTDVIFCISDEKIPAHKVILSTIPYFSLMFTSGLKESVDDEIVIADIKSPMTFHALLYFIYTGELSESFAPYALEILQLNEKFPLDERLSRLCVSMIQSKMLDKDNIFPVYDFAKNIEDADLIYACEYFMSKNFEDLTFPIQSIEEESKSEKQLQDEPVIINIERALHFSHQGLQQQPFVLETSQYFNRIIDSTQDSSSSVATTDDCGEDIRQHQQQQSQDHITYFTNDQLEKIRRITTLEVFDMTGYQSFHYPLLVNDSNGDTSGSKVYHSDHTRMISTSLGDLKKHSGSSNHVIGRNSPSSSSNLKLGTFPYYRVGFFGDHHACKSLILKYLMKSKDFDGDPKTEAFTNATVYGDDGLTQLKFEVFYTGGMEEYRALMDQWYRSVEVIVLCFDVTNSKSLENLQKNQMPKIERAKDGVHFGLLIVATKIQQIKERSISSEEGLRFAKEIGALYIETSVELDIHVDKCFKTIGRMIVDRGFRPCPLF